MVRKPAVAGAFYPGDKKTLLNTIGKFLKCAKSFEIKNLKGLIVPHAGYVFSGQTAAIAFKYFENLPLKKRNIFLIGAAHRFPIFASVGNYDYYETPLGKVLVSKKICKEILKNKNFEFIEQAHQSEHSLEVQIPFLQKIFNDNFEIIPILAGAISEDALFQVLEKYFLDDDNLFVFSTDMSHFLPQEKAEKTDKNSIDIIVRKNISKKDEIDACGKIPVTASMLLAEKYGFNINLLNYTHSGKIIEDRDSVVGYASFIISKD
jgi:MEMO1 family protein